MNRKFVKENKQVLKEFIGKLLANILVKKNKRELDKVIAADPTLKNKKHTAGPKKIEAYHRIMTSDFEKKTGPYFDQPIVKKAYQKSLRKKGKK